MIVMAQVLLCSGQGNDNFSKATKLKVFGQIGKIFIWDKNVKQQIQNVGSLSHMW